MTFRTNLDDPRLTGSVSSTLCGAFLAYAGHAGADRTTLLEAAGLSEETLADPEARPALKQFALLVRSAQAAIGRDGLLVGFASHADFSEVSIAGLIANASETMLDALMQLNRYGRLTIETSFEGDTPLRFERGEDADWIIDQRAAPAVFPELIEMAFTYLITGPRRFLPQSHVIGVQLAYPKPAHSAIYDQIWDCPVEYGAPRTALRIARWVADHQVRLQPAYAFGILTAHADEMLERLEKSRTLAGKVEALILPVLHTGIVSIDWTAEKLGLSRQGLQRRLAQEDISFEQIHSDLRHHLAREYLTAGKVTIAETAYLLGYSEPSPFSRAFKRWEGISPQAFQRSAGE